MIATTSDRSWDRGASAGRDVVLLLTRILMGWIFVRSGLAKMGDLGAFSAALARRGVLMPEVLAPVGAAVEFFGGVALVLGLRVRAAALLMIGFVVAATLISHRFWEIADAAARRSQTVQFEKNMAMIGGLLALWIAGAGRLAVERLWRRQTALATGTSPFAAGLSSRQTRERTMSLPPEPHRGATDLRLEAEQPDPLLQAAQRPSRGRIAMVLAAILLIVGVVFYALTQGEPQPTARAPSASSPPAAASNAPTTTGQAPSSTQDGREKQSSPPGPARTRAARCRRNTARPATRVHPAGSSSAGSGGPDPPKALRARTNAVAAGTFLPSRR